MASNLVWYHVTWYGASKVVNDLTDPGILTIRCKGTLAECTVSHLKFQLNNIRRMSWSLQPESVYESNRKYLQRKLARVLERNPEYAI